ncbi:membrane hypothetical protein [Candidatus Terasakiella magnetica]|uniref:Uncharacterized protein n=1 Tax=Candidatus Terasakiella magnetica TaxID=1867952 RepID=A0A1C3RI31_9PROT|nr:hypothetical protein [Candidatus Terasakiella magnetica]SCA56941.1 membrane hypothetical protein [Candidatus Terasakiella magnetica]
MTDLFNSALFLSLLFPAITVMGVVPLLRWALSGEKQEVFASLSIGLGCLMGVITAFGRVGEPFQFGMNAMAYGLGFVTIFALVYSLLFNNQILKLLSSIAAILIWVWILTGMSLELEMLIKASLAGSVLLVLSLVIGLKSRGQFVTAQNLASSVIPLIIMAATLGLFASWVGDIMARNFAIALCVVGVCALFWKIPKFAFNFQENAILPLSLSVAALGWDMWLQGHTPLLSLACLSMALFSHRAVEKLLEGRSLRIIGLQHLVLVAFCLLPVVLSLVFFDILRAL